MKELKELIKGDVHFKFFRKNELYYKTDCGFEFRIPVEDTGDGTFFATEKAILFLRYILYLLTFLHSEGK